MLVASHEDLINKYTVKLKNQEETIKELQEEKSVMKSSLICGCEETYEKEIRILQTEIKDICQSRKNFMT